MVSTSLRTVYEVSKAISDVLMRRGVIDEAGYRWLDI